MTYDEAKTTPPADDFAPLTCTWCDPSADDGDPCSEACEQIAVEVARARREAKREGRMSDERCPVCLGDRDAEECAEMCARAKRREELRKEEEHMGETIESIIRDIGAGVTVRSRGGHYEAGDVNYEARGYGDSVLAALRSLRSALVIRRAEKSESVKAAE